MPKLRKKFGTDLSHSKTVRVIKYLLSLCVTTLGVLLLFEVFIRLFVYGTGPKYVFDPDLGYANGAGTTIFNGVEGFGTVHFIADGEIATPYSEGKDVVVLGDSHTIAVQVNDTKNYASVAEELLHKEGYSLDLHNYGVMGNRMPDYIYLASDVKQRYHPKILVVQLSVDDFWGNSFDPNQPSYFAVASDGSLIIKHNVPIRKHIAFVESLNQFSALTNYAYERLFRMSNQIVRQKGNADNNYNIVLHQPKQVDTDLVKMELRALIEAYPGIPIIIVMLPSTPRIQNSDILFQETDYQVVIEIIQSITGLYLVNPSLLFNNLVSEGKFPRGFSNTAPGISHLNEDGHRIVGQLLAQALEKIVR